MIVRPTVGFKGGKLQKNGIQTITPLSTNVKVTGWIPSTPYLGTNITSEGILVPLAVNVNYTIYFQVNGSSGITTSRARAMNGSTLLQQLELGSSATSATITGSFVGTGEVFSLEAYMTSSASSRNIINAATYIMVEKIG